MRSQLLAGMCGWSLLEQGPPAAHWPAGIYDFSVCVCVSVLVLVCVCECVCFPKPPLSSRNADQ